jgi:hypothetical protein
MKTTKTETLYHLGVKNLNGRIYQNNENLRKSIEDYNNKISKYGQIDFPETFDTTLKEVSHVIENVRIEDDKVVGDVKILDTPKGRFLKDIMNRDNYVFRSRAAGHTNEDGTVNIKEIFAFDAIPKNMDSFDMTNKPKEKEVKRLYSDLDPYGEEDWEE